MCRLSAEMFAVTGGGGVFATAAAFAKAHWDAIKDRRAFRAAKERERLRRGEFSDVKDVGESD